MSKIKVLVNGSAGKMGRETVNAVRKQPDMELVGEVDIANTGGETTRDLGKAIKALKPDVIVEFTHPNVAMKNIRTILENNVHAVVGTTGLSEGDLKEIESICKAKGVNCLVAPNFAVGAVLMMRFAREASRHLPNVEIIELHHDKKADAPSGTAIKTAEMILEEKSRRDRPSSGKVKEIEKLDGARGGSMDDIRVHSVRLPGFVAHQEVIFGGLGQTLTIRHDSISRESFMPGVMLSIRKIGKLKGLTYGLESVL